MGLDCALTEYASFFEENDLATDFLRKAQEQMEDAIQGIDRKDVEDSDQDSRYTEEEVDKPTQHGRSIFDDVGQLMRNADCKNKTGVLW